MRATTLRWIILITTVVVVLLVAAQLYWLNKVYNYEQKEFSSSVVKSIQGVYEDLNISNYSTSHLRSLIELPDPNTFLFKIDSTPDRTVLLENLLDNLEDFQVFTDCKVGVYEPYSHKYTFQVYLAAAATWHVANSGHDINVYKKPYRYIALYFPHRNQYIISSIVWWIVSAAMLLVVLVALALCVFYLYKQKFLNEIQNDFIQNVTHEFQTPLTTLTLGLDAISKPLVAGQQNRLDTYIKVMQSQTDYLKQHIENLMKVLKAESQGLVMEKSSTVPNDLLRKVLLQLQTVIEEKGAKTELILEHTDTSIQADASSLYMSLLNLVSNALKYSINPVIRIQTKRHHNRYLISIKDNGVGINRKDNRKLFKKFYRVPSGDVHNVKGLGLGLYFVKKIVEGHKGTITINSKTGQGSEFLIDLPLN